MESQNKNRFRSKSAWLKSWVAVMIGFFLGWTVLPALNILVIKHGTAGDALSEAGHRILADFVPTFVILTAIACVIFVIASKKNMIR